MNTRISILVLIVFAFAHPAPAGPVKAAALEDGNDITWHHVGPGGGGWIESLAWDPVKPDTLYAGGDCGGFFVSADGGKTFEIRNSGLRCYFIESIAIQSRGNVWLVGTESGIFRSTDAGANWKWIHQGFPAPQGHSFSCPISVVCFDPLHGEVAYAGVGRQRSCSGGQGAIYRSDDAGLSWHEVAAGQLPKDAVVTDIKITAKIGLLLAATNKGIFASPDGGTTWKLSVAGLPHGNCMRLAPAGSDPNTVYVSLRTTARDAQPWNGGVYRSDDAGSTWRSACGAGLASRVGKSGGSPYLTSTYKEVVVSPHDRDVVFAGDKDWVSAGVRKTVDGGRMWTPVTRYRGDAKNMDLGWLTQWGPAVECMAISPLDANRLAAGTSGQLFVTGDAGATWQQRYCRELPGGRFAGNGLELTCVFDIVCDPARAGRAYFCYFDIGLLVTDDGGKTFHHSVKGMKDPGNCFAVVADPKAAFTLWAATGWWEHNAGCICRSDDDGLSWKVVGSPPSGLPDGQNKRLVMAPASPVGKRRLLTTSNGNGIYESTDGGTAWRCVNGNLPAAAKSPRGLLLDGADANHVVIALGGSPGQGGIYETRDAGSTWNKCNKEVAFCDITCLAADPKDFSTMYVAARDNYDQAARRFYPGGVFKSTDGGKSWRHLVEDRFVASVVVSPADSKIVYAATTDHPYHDDNAAYGVVVSRDGGSTWRRQNSGLSNLCVTCLSIDPREPSVLYAGTGGTSVAVGVDALVK